jgi:hypothetical protein
MTSLAALLEHSIQIQRPENRPSHHPHSQVEQDKGSPDRQEHDLRQEQNKLQIFTRGPRRVTCKKHSLKFM